MTLHTRIAVTAPGLDLRGAFDKARDLLGIPDTAEWEQDADSIHMGMGQGFKALMWVESSDGTPEGHDEGYCYEDDEDGHPVLDCSGQYHDPGHYVMIHFDTAYGYQADNGAGCGDLHAYLVREMGRWLSNGDLSWVWYDESDTGWNTSNDDLSGLGDPEVGRPGSTVVKQTYDWHKAALDRLIHHLDASGIETTRL